jgi:hypothetical protein
LYLHQADGIEFSCEGDYPRVCYAGSCACSP